MAVVSLHLRYVHGTQNGTISTFLISPRRPPLVLEAWNRIVTGIEGPVDGWYSLGRLGFRRYGRDGPVGTWR